MMRAARLHPGARSLRLDHVPVLEPTGDQVLVRVAGAGVCRSDLHVLDGAWRDSVRPPVTMGHEIAGRVESTGVGTVGLEPGEPVVVMVGWGCGHCASCVAGHEQLCPDGDEAGATRDGGFAEYVLVPHRRHVVSLEGLDPVQAAPLGCAGLSAYAAVKRVRATLSAGGTCVVVGVGGLGQYAVQFARATTGATVIAVDSDERALTRALEVRAHQVIRSGTGAAAEITEATHGRGADAVIDFVGSDETLALAVRTVAPRGTVALLGLAGGSVPFAFRSLPYEAVLTTVVAGTGSDLREAVRLARLNDIGLHVQRYPLEDTAKALDALRAGMVAGRAIVVPTP